MQDHVSPLINVGKSRGFVNKRGKNYLIVNIVNRGEGAVLVLLHIPTFLFGLVASSQATERNQYIY